MLVGYGRVSSRNQSLNIQKESLLEAGCEKLFMEKESGASMSNRHELEKALEFDSAFLLIGKSIVTASIKLITANQIILYELR